MCTGSVSGSGSGSNGWSKARGVVLKALVLMGGALLLKRLTKSTTRWDHARIVADSLAGEKFSREQAARELDNYFKLRRLSCPAAEMVDGSRILYFEQAFWRTPHKRFQQPDRYHRVTEPLNIDLSNEESKRRLFNRLLYRSKQRGYLELDLVLGKWVEDHIHSLDVNGVKSLVHVLDLENPDLWKWLSGQEQPPDAVKANPVFMAVAQKVASNLDNHAAPETHATPGQSWVRGWDDFKKGRDSPIAGNQ